VPRKTVRTKKQKEARKRAIKRWVIGVAITIVVLFVAVVVILNQRFARIDHINVIGNETVHTEDITEVVQETIAGKVLWIFPRDTVLFYKKSRVRSVVVDTFSRVESVRLSTSDFDVLNVSITEHQPEFLWCGDVAGEGLRDCYYMDKTSYIFSHAPYFTDNVYLKFTGSHFDVPTDPLRFSVFELDRIEQVLQLRELLGDGGIVVNKIAVEDHGDYMLYLDMVDGFRLGPESRLIVNLTDTNERILEDLQVAFRTPGFREKLEAHPERLEYIDLRFTDKIVYRFQTGTPEAATEPAVEEVSE
jgi:Tfp pilus assembly protein PilZ